MHRIYFDESACDVGFYGVAKIQNSLLAREPKLFNERSKERIFFFRSLIENFVMQIGKRWNYFPRRCSSIELAWEQSKRFIVSRVLRFQTCTKVNWSCQLLEKVNIYTPASRSRASSDKSAGNSRRKLAGDWDRDGKESWFNDSFGFDCEP